MNAVVNFALRQRVLILVLFVAAMVGGYVAFQRLNIEAYPDPTPPMVDVVTQAQGLSAEEIERYITIPIEVQTAGIRHMKAIRTISLYGLSDVKLQFTFDYTYDEAEQKVLNRLAQLAPLPNGAQPQISPVSPTGEVYRYQLVGPPGYSVMDLKTLQDWVLQRRFRAVPGVVDVTGWGGKTKTYEITVDLNKLLSYGLTLPQLLQTLGNSNINVGGNTVNIGPQSAVVRGVGLVRSLDDIANTMLTQTNGSPVFVRDVATVVVGHQPRLGIAGRDDQDYIVQGTVLMRRAEQSMPTIKRVEAEVEKINSSNILPPGVRIERIYDRQDLINTTTHTVLHNMVFGIVLIFAIQWLFLGNLRSAVIVAATIPFALFFAVGLMLMRGESANLLSVGAIDFGLIVDATVLMVESIFRHLAEEPAGKPGRKTSAKGRLRGKLAVISDAASGVNRSIFFAAAIIIASFVPLFTMSGVEGHIFGPMAKTYAYALAGGLLATFTVSPAMSAMLLPDRVEERDTLLVRLLHRFYRPVLHFSLANKVLTLAGAALLVVSTGLALGSLGMEFLPKLEEGNLWIRATMPSSVSLEEGNGYVNRIRGMIKSFPEVETVVSQDGRPDDGTDATGFFNAEFFAPLKPADQWPQGVDKDELTKEMADRFAAQFPGVEFNFSQYIQDNVEEAVSGVKGENSIKVIGNDLKTLAETANKIKATIATVPGITDLAVFASLGQPTIKIEIDRERAARYGLAPGDINSTIQAAIGGQAAGDLYEYGSDRHFPIIVRLAPEYRQNLDAIRNITVGAQGGAGQGGGGAQGSGGGQAGVVQVPLTEVASVELVSGASFIYREAQQRYLPVKFSVRGRDLGSAILEAQQKIQREVQLPPGYRLEWVGEFGNLQDAINRLKIVVPASIALIALLLYVNFSSLTDTLLAISVIPMALIGGIFALVLTGTPFSVSAAIGFIALLGISVMDGIIVLSAFNGLAAMGVDRTTAILTTCETQMRPVVMTCIVACVGLLPAAISGGIGSQVQKPLALVVVGGILLAPALILVVLPALIDTFSRRIERPAAAAHAAEPAE
jgi:cobalt-zinc-cadmium resistance protein CzcA